MSGNRIKYTYLNLRNILDENNINLVEFLNRQHIIKSAKEDISGRVLRDKGGYYTLNSEGVKKYLFDKLKYGLMPNWCPSCGHIMGRNRLDQQYWPIHNRCFKCSIELLTQMKIDGTWDEYEKRYMLNKMIDTCDEAIQFYLDLKAHSNRLILLNEEGWTEKWDIPDILLFNKNLDGFIELIKLFKLNSIKSIELEIKRLNDDKAEAQLILLKILDSNITDDNIIGSTIIEN